MLDKKGCGRQDSNLHDNPVPAKVRVLSAASKAAVSNCSTTPARAIKCNCMETGFRIERNLADGGWHLQTLPGFAHPTPTTRLVTPLYYVKRFCSASIASRILFVGPAIQTRSSPTTRGLLYISSGLKPILARKFRTFTVRPPRAFG